MHLNRSATISALIGRSSMMALYRHACLVTLTVALAILPRLAEAQSCNGKGTSTTLRHADGSWSRVETDKYCNTHVENADPIAGNLQWRSVGNYKDLNHEDVVREFSRPGTFAIGSSATQPGPVIQGPPPVASPPTAVPTPAPAAPAPVPRNPSSGGDGGREGRVAPRGGGMDGSGGGGNFNLPSPGRPGDFGNQPGAPGAGGGGGGGGRKCGPAEPRGACLRHPVLNLNPSSKRASG